MGICIHRSWGKKPDVERRSGGFEKLKKISWATFSLRYPSRESLAGEKEIRAKKKEKNNEDKTRHGTLKKRKREREEKKGGGKTGEENKLPPRETEELNYTSDKRVRDLLAKVLIFRS